MNYLSKIIKTLIVILASSILFIKSTFAETIIIPTTNLNITTALSKGIDISGSLVDLGVNSTQYPVEVDVYFEEKSSCGEDSKIVNVVISKKKKTIFKSELSSKFGSIYSFSLAKNFLKKTQVQVLCNYNMFLIDLAELDIEVY